MGAYEGKNGPEIFRESKAKTNGFKKGGKTEKAYGGKSEMAKGGCMKKGGKAVMSHAAKGKKPARASGGGVFSTASSGTPRGKASHY